MTISALCVFSGDLPRTDSDAAAEALRAAGYEVFRLPPDLQAKHDGLIKDGGAVEGDDFIEIRRDGDDDSIMWKDAERIVDPLGGYVDCVGPASDTTFEELRTSSAFKDEDEPF